ncbi:unnamed protein product [Brachionus calyciflorus]|uniref:C2 domain-containing protein n=1 Tax=Brachionus calyciflorus TaxID=104777 RepID=A0A814N327_9BILA|nr:unnamed protein product [Brachionus calyciflorus]
MARYNTYYYLFIYLICQKFKEAHINGLDNNFNTYIVVKIGSVKSTTIAVQGVQPAWHEEFFFEINELDEGVTIELWNRGMLWDKLLGLYWLPLFQINHSNIQNDETNDLKISLDSELCLEEGKIIGTQHPTGHLLMINARIEISNTEISEIESLELEHKIDILNEFFKKEGSNLESDVESLLIFKDIQYRSSINDSESITVNNSENLVDDHIGQMRVSEEELDQENTSDEEEEETGSQFQRNSQCNFFFVTLD